MSNDMNVLDPIAGTELLGYSLDLGRPELVQLMDRYAPSSPHLPEVLLGPPTAVVVTRWAGQEAPVKKELEADGWSVQVCDGPGRRVCPLMGAEECPLRARADAVVVFVSSKEGLGSTPRLRCAADSASPGVVALEGRIDSARFSGTTASVGELRGPGAITSAVSALLVNGWTPGEI
jgi:hypothetical protein